MWEYLKYLILIVIGMCIANIWIYINRLELTNQMLTSNMFRELQKQREQKHDSD